jgi:hypothetical protein
MAPPGTFLDLADPEHRHIASPISGRGKTAALAHLVFTLGAIAFLRGTDQLLRHIYGNIEPMEHRPKFSDRFVHFSWSHQIGVTERFGQLTRLD